MTGLRVISGQRIAEPVSRAPPPLSTISSNGKAWWVLAK